MGASDFHWAQKSMLAFGARLPYIGSKCKRIIELKQKALDETIHRRKTMSSLFAMTCFSVVGDIPPQATANVKENNNGEKDKLTKRQEERVARLVKRVQQVSLDEGFVEENSEQSRQMKSLLRMRNDHKPLTTNTEEEENKAKDSSTTRNQCNNLHVTQYRLKLSRLHSISR